MKLIVEPEEGAGPLLAAIAKAKKSVEIAIFRFDRKDVELALTAAAAKGVRVTALIASANRGGKKTLRQLELRLLEAGVIVARTADDLVRYHAKYLLIDRRVLYVLSFNFTTLDIGRSRGFGIVTTRASVLQDAIRLFKADCTRTRYTPKVETFVVSPANSRRVLAAFLKGAKTQLLIYDVAISDKAILQVLRDRAKAGVEIKVIGHVVGAAPFAVKRLAGLRLHTRTIIRDRRQAFVGSQSLRAAELDARREVGIVVTDASTVKRLAETFEADWTRKKKGAKKASVLPHAEDRPAAVTTPPKVVKKAVKGIKTGLKPLETTVQKVVKKAVAKAVVEVGDDVLGSKDVKDTVKKLVKKAVKKAVKDAGLS